MEVSVREVKVTPFNLRLKHPFVYSLGILKTLPYILVKISSKAGYGVGEGSPAWDITGETQGGAIRVINEFLKPAVKGKKTLKEIEESMKLVVGNPSAKISIEMAFLDMIGKIKKKPFYTFLGKRRRKWVKVPYVLATRKIKKIRKELEGIETDIVKLKVGFDRYDEKRLKTIREVFDGEIVVDANQAWKNWKVALSRIRRFKKFGVKYVEQPLPAKSIIEMKKLREKSPIPIMADESCHSFADLELLVELDAVDYVNIKIMKVGSFLESLRMMDYCKKNGIGCIIGSMVESSIATTASVGLGLIRRNVEHVEAVGPWMIKNDVKESSLVYGPRGVSLEKSMIGLGINL